MTKALVVFLGGGVGSCARYLATLALARAMPGAWPWGTLTVNCLGAFLIEIVFMFTLRAAGASDHMRLLLATGFLGGFTTYSSFNHELISLARGGQAVASIGYFLMTVIGALAFGLAGLALGKWLFPVVSAG